MATSNNRKPEPPTVCRSEEGPGRNINKFPVPKHCRLASRSVKASNHRQHCALAPLHQDEFYNSSVEVGYHSAYVECDIEDLDRLFNNKIKVSPLSVQAARFSMIRSEVVSGKRKRCGGCYALICTDCFVDQFRCPSQLNGHNGECTGDDDLDAPAAAGRSNIDRGIAALANCTGIGPNTKSLGDITYDKQRASNAMHSRKRTLAVEKANNPFANKGASCAPAAANAVVPDLFARKPAVQSAAPAKKEAPKPIVKTLYYDRPHDRWHNFDHNYHDRIHHIRVYSSTIPVEIRQPSVESAFEQLDDLPELDPELVVVQPYTKGHAHLLVCSLQRQLDDRLREDEKSGTTCHFVRDGYGYRRVEHGRETLEMRTRLQIGRYFFSGYSAFTPAPVVNSTENAVPDGNDNVLTGSDDLVKRRLYVKVPAARLSKPSSTWASYLGGQFSEFVNSDEFAEFQGLQFAGRMAIDSVGWWYGKPRVDNTQWDDGGVKRIHSLTGLTSLNSNLDEINAMEENGFNAYRNVDISLSVYNSLTIGKMGKPSDFTQQQYASQVLTAFGATVPADVCINTASYHHQALLAVHHLFKMQNGNVREVIEKK